MEQLWQYRGEALAVILAGLGVLGRRSIITGIGSAWSAMGRVIDTLFDALESMVRLESCQGEVRAKDLTIEVLKEENAELRETVARLRAGRTPGDSAASSAGSPPSAASPSPAPTTSPVTPSSSTR